jgi:uncharacterized membrane protein YkoI
MKELPMSNRMVLLALASLGFVVPGSMIGCAEHSHSDHGCECREKHEKDGEKDAKEEKEEKENKISLDKSPPAVVDAVKKEVPDGTIIDAEKEQKHDQTIYEMDVKSGDIVYEVKISEAGKFISKKIDDEKDEKDEKK